MPGCNGWRMHRANNERNGCWDFPSIWSQCGCSDWGWAYFIASCRSSDCGLSRCCPRGGDSVGSDQPGEANHVNCECARRRARQIPVREGLRRAIPVSLLWHRMRVLGRVQPAPSPAVGSRYQDGTCELGARREPHLLHLQNQTRLPRCDRPAMPHEVDAQDCTLWSSSQCRGGHNLSWW